MIIEYQAGAGGTVGAHDVMKATPDGHTLMLANTGVMVINPALNTRLPEDFGKFLAAEMPRWADAVKKSGARMD